MSKSDLITCILVDDESRARSTLRSLVEEFCPELEIVGEAEDVASAVRLIAKTQPKLVFLDIEMPGLTGLQLLDFFNPESISFEIIFTTAYSEYAVEAFRLSAIDYLLKPIQIDQLESAVKKLRKPQVLSSSDRIESLKINLNHDSPFLKIAVPVSDGILFIKTSDLTYIKANGAYSEFFLADGSKLLVSKNLKEFENLLRLSNFVRPHRSYIVNLHFLKQLLRKDGGYLIMDEGCHIHISPSVRQEIFSKIEALKLN